MKTTDPQDEIFPIVNENDAVIGKITKGEAHKSPNIIHRAVVVLILDKLGRVLITKRGLTKDTSPGKWTHSVGGHVDFGDEYSKTAIREMYEELGLKISIEDLIPLGKIIVSEPWEKEMTQVFRYDLKKDISFKPDSNEVSKMKFVDKNELHKMLNSEKWTQSALDVFKNFVLN